MINLSVLGTILFVVLLGLFIMIGVQLARFESERYKQQELENVQLRLEEIKHPSQAGFTRISIRLLLLKHWWP
jgi:uncharacterized membrane-anchored protein YhcB (DUF1043 family)